MWKILSKGEEIGEKRENGLAGKRCKILNGWDREKVRTPQKAGRPASGRGVDGKSAGERSRPASLRRWVAQKGAAL
ncbi:unnamed protein product [Linum trigynum]|uniref:Uncharacterized protein n=1 Tax=Linum trigynum TaxID=586398 RepID=A0AAV2FFF1_9ROSI